MMKAAIVAAVSALLCSCISAAPLSTRIIVNPPLTYPNLTTVWYTGQKNVTATWDVPSYAKGYTGRLLLGYLDKNDSMNEHLFRNPLADGFNLTDGRVSFDIPCDNEIKSRATYVLVLMGDSGNKGDMFTIHRNATACPNFKPKKPRPAPAELPPPATPPSTEAARESRKLDDEDD